MRAREKGSPEELQREVYRGAEVQAVLDALGRLRVAVFREFPYLYDGDEEYEREYVKVYGKSVRSLVVVLRAAGEVVGASTALPMSDVGPEFQAPFRAAGFDLAEVFYFGESVVLPEFRGCGSGRGFFELRERHARALGYRFTTFCAVNRASDHPQRPPSYRPLDGFWTRRGYVRREDLCCRFDWREVGEEKESSHGLTFWVKDWNGDRAGAE